MHPYIAEFVGTAILLLVGNGVVANVVLADTKGGNAGWLTITTGWGMAVFVAVACTQQFSGAHINPAVTIGLAAAGEFPWTQSAGYVAAQFGGAFFGSVLVLAIYYAHYQHADDADAKLATFCTGPAIRNYGLNIVSETIATFVLVFTVLAFAAPAMKATPDGPDVPIGLGAVGAIPVGLLVLAIGISLGGTTGFAINPARDLSPRIAHTLLPVPGKRDSDWSYAWVPVVGPVLGALTAAILYRLLIP